MVLVSRVNSLSFKTIDTLGQISYPDKPGGRLFCALQAVLTTSLLCPNEATGSSLRRDASGGRSRILRSLPMPRLALDFSQGLPLALLGWKHSQGCSDLGCGGPLPGRKDPSNQGPTAPIERKDGREEERGREGRQPRLGLPSSDTYCALMWEEGSSRSQDSPHPSV